VRVAKVNPNNQALTRNRYSGGLSGMGHLKQEGIGLATPL